MTAPKRMPKNLRRRVAVARNYTFLGHPLREGMAERWPEGIPIRDHDGTHIFRARTHEHVPAVTHCECGHRERAHGTDRRNRPICFGSSMCGCSEYRPLEKKA